MFLNRRKFISRVCLSSALTALTPVSLRAESYVVQKGDTLSRIATRFGISVADLKFRNQLPSNLIRVGQNLIIPSLNAEVARVKEITSRIKINKSKWKYLVAHHSATPHGNAKSYDRVDRQHGMENGLAYHFVIGNGLDSGDGEIEIGTRWTCQIHGGHVRKWEFNNHGIGICLVGNFEEQKPTPKQMDSLKALVGFLAEDLLGGKYTFLVHKEINPTLCPGKHFPTEEMHRLCR